MDILIVLFMAFVAAPFALLLWMPGWSSFTVAAIALLGLMGWLWFDAATAPSNHQPGAGMIDWLIVAFSSSVIAGLCVKTVRLARRK